MYASPTPVKDMEMVVLGSSATGLAFKTALYSALTTITDRYSVPNFNVAMFDFERQKEDPRYFYAADLNIWQVAR